MAYLIFLILSIPVIMALENSGSINSYSATFNTRPLSVFTGNCNASIPRGATLWKNLPGLMEIFFPKIKPPRCVTPSSCSANSTLHANIILQPGDSLKITFDLDVTNEDKPLTKPVTTISTTLKTSTSEHPLNTIESSTSIVSSHSTIVSSLKVNRNTSESEEAVNSPSHLHNGEKSPILLKRFPRQVSDNKSTTPWPTETIRETSSSTATLSFLKSNKVIDKNNSFISSQRSLKDGYGHTIATVLRPTTSRKLSTKTPIVKSNVVNIVTLYKVNSEAFDACDISSGLRIGQVKSEDGSPLGLITLPPSLLSIDDNYFLGRSLRWGGECLKVKVSVKTSNCGEGDHCTNNGVCYATIATPTFQCACCESGSINEICGPSNICSYNPCQNDAICVRNPRDKDDEFRCLCAPGFKGKLCEERVSACDSIACRNNGTCVVAHDGRGHCSCQPGYIGLYCEEELTGCDSSPCVHGICVDEPHGYRCFCQPGFAGPKCDFEYNECQSSPCYNGGTCEDHVDGFQCHCHPGYSGSRCENKINLCEPNPCGNNQKCIDHGTNISCQCIPDLSPELCSEFSSACNPNPCLRGGTCWVSSGSFFCACKPGFTGNKCEESIAESKRSALTGLQMDFDQLELKSPLSLHLDHAHSIYVAFGTLACAVLIVLITVSVCYCRVHETYKRWSPGRIPSLCRDYRMPSLSKNDHGMDVPLAVAVETECYNAARSENKRQTPCKVYWGESHRDVVVLD